jgi:hypothetical protein
MLHFCIMFLRHDKFGSTETNMHPINIKLLHVNLVLEGDLLQIFIVCVCLKHTVFL